MRRRTILGAATAAATRDARRVRRTATDPVGYRAQRRGEPTDR
jgi:hypothetical protein